MGLEPIWKDHRIVLVSDGGAAFRAKKLLGLMWRADRYTSVVERQARGVRKRWLISDFIDDELDGTYWGIGTPVSRYKSTVAETQRTFVGYSDDLVDSVVSKVRTDLDAFSDAEIGALENQGYHTSEAAIHTHLPELIRNPADPQPPHPDWLDEALIRKALRNSSKRKLLGRY
jgi:NTE family protein